jgi:D-inositol-3-phosphate glycosyltransferase
MKIIQIYPYYPPHLGGAEQRVKELSEKLAQKDYHVEVYTSDIGCPVNNRQTPTANLHINYLKGFEIANTPILPMLLFKLFSVPKDAIIHLHIAQAYVPEVVWLVSKLRGIPYVAHIRLDTGPSSKWGIFLHAYKRIFLSKVLNDATKIIVLTDDYKYLISRKYGIKLQKITVIPNGNSFGKNDNTMRNANPTKLLFVGRLSKQKNIPLLLDAFKRAHEINNKITLTIIGDGTYRQYIHDFISMNRLTNSIICKGIRYGQMLKNEYKNADIFISTTNQESFGTVFLEAMASGLPIIASNIPGLRNVVKNGKTGLLVSPTVMNFTKAIQRMTNDESLRKKLIHNSTEEVKKYDWNTIVEKFEEIYQEVSNEIN